MNGEGVQRVGVAEMLIQSHASVRLLETSCLMRRSEPARVLHCVCVSVLM